jgi:hypothetical protein
MKKIVLVCGVIAGIIPVTWCIFSLQIFTGHLSMNQRLFMGYATMVLGFSLIYVGVKNYRDNQNSGIISFGKAFKMALLITAVASTVYVGIWLVDFYFFIPDYMDKYAAAMLTDLKASHASQASIDKQMAEVAAGAKMIKNPLFHALITYTEIVPPGIVISLIVALILKKNSKPTIANL